MRRLGQPGLPTPDSRATLSTMSRASTWALLAASLALGCGPRTQPAEPVRPLATTDVKAPSPSGVREAPRAADDVRHLLNRFAFGPRPGDIDAILEQGTRVWFEHQLRADELPDPRAERAVSPYRRALAPPDRLPDLFTKGGTPVDTMEMGTRQTKSRALLKQVAVPRMLLELQMAELARHVESEFQLREVMVDFWTNHFNVYARKDEVPLLIGDYVERVLRPHALGRFEDLLLATAQHPAMLRYLDNASSRAKPKHGQKGLPGITENYARELLELHTLGVDGGYQQADVIAVARILTGWTFQPGKDGRGYTFAFDPHLHDQKAKLALGVEYPAGVGQEEGERLLRFLAAHRSTADHLARKLCIRFVADEPEADCVEVTRAAFLASGGDIKSTLTALFAADSFWAPEHRKNKLKTSLEFMLSAVRGTGARLAGTTDLARIAAGMGEAPFLEPSPTGRSDASEYWLQSFTLKRMEFAQDLAYGRVQGVALNGRAALAGGSDPKNLATALSAALLGEPTPVQTLSVIEHAVASAPDEATSFSTGVALCLSSPEFQWR